MRTAPDPGQESLCLRAPVPAGAETAALVVDLPESKRSFGGSPASGSHTRYRLEPPHGTDRRQPLWNFQVPRHLIPNHNDIFTFRGKALILTLMQASGAVASLAGSWRDSFEPE